MHLRISDRSVSVSVRLSTALLSGDLRDLQGSLLRLNSVGVLAVEVERFDLRLEGLDSKGVEGTGLFEERVGQRPRGRKQKEQEGQRTVSPLNALSMTAKSFSSMPYSRQIDNTSSIALVRRASRKAPLASLPAWSNGSSVRSKPRCLMRLL
jgi:hypothetical protein